MILHLFYLKRLNFIFAINVFYYILIYVKVQKITDIILELSCAKNAIFSVRTTTCYPLHLKVESNKTSFQFTLYQFEFLSIPLECTNKVLIDVNLKICSQMAFCIRIQNRNGLWCEARVRAAPFATQINSQDKTHAKLHYLKSRLLCLRVLHLYQKPVLLLITNTQCLLSNPHILGLLSEAKR